ncbi:hypothetical protein HanIR_Chr01g0045061 [Helianthus annuus]|nr:hypothetical protein HanIR_Chr01g0045061 [Helianthus annuus]
MIIMYSWPRLPKDHEMYQTSSLSKQYNDHSYDSMWCDELCGTMHLFRTEQDIEPTV